MRYLARDVIAVRLCNDGELLKDVMHQLGRDYNLNFAVHRLRSGIHQLARLASFLAFRRGLGEQEVLATKTHA